MIDDVFRNKSAIIHRCLARVREEVGGDLTRLDDFTIQDAVVLNLLRACEAAIDLAMHGVAVRRLGVPQTSRDAFEMLGQAGALRPETAAAMQNMVGFRNVAVHSYQQLQRRILEAIIATRLADFEAFLAELGDRADTDSH